MLSFLKYYLKSMRLYYCFVTLTAGYAGLSLYSGEMGVGTRILAGFIFFCCWGVNQIINDYLNIEEDRINAPNRPMVTGKLAAKPALALSGLILLGIGGYALASNPASLIPAVAGVVLNIVYAYAKAWGVWGNVVFGLTIACCPWFGYTLAGGGLAEFFTRHWLIWLCVALMNMVMTYFTYFKDEGGDRAAGQRTLIVRLGPERAALYGLWVCLIPVVLFWLFSGGYCFAATSMMATVLLVMTGWLFYKDCRGPKTYYNLKYNFSALCASQSALICLTSPVTGLSLGVVSVIAIFVTMSYGYGDATE